MFSGDGLGPTGPTAITARKLRGEILAFLRYVARRHLEHKRVAIILKNVSPRLTTGRKPRP
jgi:hypothetical protein